MIHIEKNELCFLINGKKLHFGYKEFAIITGLRCDPPPTLKFKNKEGSNTLKSKFFPEDNKVRTENIKSVFANKTTIATDEEMVKLASLYFLEAILLALDMNKYIDMDHLYLADNLDDFNSYPWGRLVFDKTISSLKSSLDTIKTSKATYQLGGFPLALLPFIFETIPLLAERSFAQPIDTHYHQRILN